jgi:glycosyltransferase involved in cell wall biosynthesis
MRVHVVSLTDHRRDVRFQKVRRSLKAAGVELTFSGIARDADAGPREIAPECDSLPLRLTSRADRLRTLPAVRRHFARGIAASRPDVLYCVNEEALLLCFGLPAARRGRPVLLDLYDSLGLRVEGGVRGLLAAAASSQAQSRAEAIVVTDRRRFGLLAERARRKASVVENFPEYGDATPPESVPAGPPRVLAAGGLSTDRGFVALVAAAESTGAIVHALGRPDPAPEVRQALQSPNVRFEGYADQAAVFAKAAACDALFGHYEPNSTNSVYASPNKLFDAYRVGRPLLLNSEVVVARAPEHRDVVIDTPFGDVRALGGALAGLPGRRVRLREHAAALFERGSQEFAWETQAETLLGVLRSLAGGR